MAVSGRSEVPGTQVVKEWRMLLSGSVGYSTGRDWTLTTVPTAVPGRLRACRTSSTRPWQQQLKNQMNATILRML